MRPALRTLLPILALAALGVATLAHRPADAAVNASGNLRTGGTIKGDISTSGHETDTITVDLQQGMRADLKWSAGFNAVLTLADPNAAPITIELGGSRSSTVKAWPVPATGTYTFKVSSADVSQGYYSLTVLPFWEKTVVVSGTGDGTLDVPMPAFATIKGKVVPLPGASNPSITSFLSPTGTEMLVRPVGGNPGLAKLPTIQCPDAGVYHLVAGASQGTQQFQATLSRRAPKIARESLDISNGLDQVSFETGGVGDYFHHACANCHSWANSYAGVRARGRASLFRMKTGNMPKNAPRASSETMDLVSEWIKTGYGK